jgi:TolA-binding protein
MKTIIALLLLAIPALAADKPDFDLAEPKTFPSRAQDIEDVLFEIRELSARIDTMHQDADLRHQESTARQQELDNRVRAMQDDLTKLRATVTTLEGTVDKIEARQSAMQDWKTSYENRLTELQHGTSKTKAIPKSRGAVYQDGTPVRSTNGSSNGASTLPGDGNGWPPVTRVIREVPVVRTVRYSAPSMPMMRMSAPRYSTPIRSALFGGRMMGGFSGGNC